jgi:hypothetical protein
MARLRWTLATTAEVAFTTSLKMAASITTPANQRVAIRAFQISFDGVSSTAGSAEVQLVIHSSSGTSLGRDAVEDPPRHHGSDRHSSGNFNCSAEPTYSAILKSYEVNQMTGYERAFAQDEEIELAGGERFGILVRASSAGERARVY